MHAFTRPSQHLRNKMRQALFRSLHNSSLYRRLLVAKKAKGGRLQTVGRAIFRKLNSQHREGISLLKFIYGQLYNGKLAQRYGHTPTDICPLCHKPDSCTHIAGECSKHDALRIGRHNAACQLIHAAICKTAKGGAALHAAQDLVLVATDTSTRSQTTATSLATLSSSQHNPAQTGGRQLPCGRYHTTRLARKPEPTPKQ